jgi:hypothetical protein
VPAGQARFLKCQFGQCLEQRQLVGGDLAIAVEDRLDLVDRAQCPARSKFEQQRIPTGSCTPERVLRVPAADQLKADALEQQLQVFRAVVLQHSPRGIAFVGSDVGPGQWQRDEQSTMGAQKTPQCESGVEQIRLGHMHEDRTAQDAVEAAAERLAQEREGSFGQAAGESGVICQGSRPQSGRWFHSVCVESVGQQLRQIAP